MLGDLVVVRHDDDAGQSDDDPPPSLVLGGVAMKAIAQFHVAGRRCLAGVADSAAAYVIGPEAGAPTDLRGRTPASVTLDGTSFDLWQLPEWLVGGSTVLHLVLAARDGRPVTRNAHRQLLAVLHVEHGGAPVVPLSTGTYGGDRLLQCTAEFRGQITGLTMDVDHAGYGA